MNAEKQPQELRSLGEGEKDPWRLQLAIKLENAIANRQTDCMISVYLFAISNTINSPGREISDKVAIKLMDSETVIEPICIMWCKLNKPMTVYIN